MEGEVKGKTFKLKGHALPGINQRIDAKATNVAEQGLAGSSVFQQIDPMINPTMPVSPVMDPMGGVGVGTGIPGAFPNKPSMAKDMKTGKYKQKFEK